MDWFVYMLRCEGGRLYTGVTGDLARRYREHCGEGGRGAKFTALYRPVAFAAAWSAPDKGAALRLELGIKALTRAQKLRLVAGEAPEKLALCGCARIPVTPDGAGSGAPPSAARA